MRRIGRVVVSLLMSAGIGFLAIDAGAEVKDSSAIVSEIAKEQKEKCKMTIHDRQEHSVTIEMPDGTKQKETIIVEKTIEMEIDCPQGNTGGGGGGHGNMVA